MTKRQLCQTKIYGPCSQQAVAYCLWQDCSHGVWYCQYHRDYALERRPTLDCPDCGDRRSMGPMLNLYAAYRHLWMTEGGLANRDGMVAAVTLDEPVGWDNWGSVLTPRPKRKPASTRRKVGELRLADTVGIFPVWMLFIMSVCAAMAGLVGLFTLLGK